MKNPFKHEHTSKDQPFQAHMTPEPASLKDLTDAEMEQVQGGKGSTSKFYQLCCSGKHFNEVKIVM